MKDEYSALTLEHFRQPHQVGVLPAAPDVVQAQVGGHGQEARLRFSVRVSQGRVQAAGWNALGCPHLIAAASLSSDWLLGRTADQILMFDWRFILQSLEIPENKSGRLLVLEDALHAVAQALQRASGPV